MSPKLPESPRTRSTFAFQTTWPGYNPTQSRRAISPDNKSGRQSPAITSVSRDERSPDANVYVNNNQTLQLGICDKPPNSAIPEGQSRDARRLVQVERPFVGLCGTCGRLSWVPMAAKTRNAVKKRSFPPSAKPRRAYMRFKGKWGNDNTYEKINTRKSPLPNSLCVPTLDARRSNRTKKKRGRFQSLGLRQQPRGQRAAHAADLKQTRRCSSWLTIPRLLGSDKSTLRNP